MRFQEAIVTAELFETGAIPTGPLGLLAGVMLAGAIAGAALSGCAAVGWALRRTRQGTAARLAAVLSQTVLVVTGATLAIEAAGAPGWAATAVWALAAGVAATAFLIVVAAMLPGLRDRRRRGRPDGADQVTGAPQTGNHRSSSGSIGSSPASAA